jgi:phospholipase D1/2
MARRSHATPPATDNGARTPLRGAKRWLIVALAVCAAATLIVALVVGARAIDWHDVPAFLDRLGAWRDSPLAMIAMVGVFALGALVVFPVNLLIAASIIVFGPIVGGVVALAGSLASAAVMHQIGRAFPSRSWTRIAGAHAEKLRERVARHGIVAIAIVRLLPIAPYSIVSLAAGISGIERRAYFAGTALGMAPGIVLYAVFVDRAREVIADPRPLSWAMLAFALLLIIAFGFALRRFKRRADARRVGGAS